MAKREFEITGDIGGRSGSAGYVRYMMDTLGEWPVTVKVTLYGGSLLHALKIKNIFSEHGDVTVEYIGYGASAATIIGHGAKKTLIRGDAFYLIHKSMLRIDAWGYMNEDELAQEIRELEGVKQDAETYTRVIVQDYVACRGMEEKNGYGTDRQGAVAVREGSRGPGAGG